LVPGFGHNAINYPSMQLSVKNNTESTIGVFSRTVTNVSSLSKWEGFEERNVYDLESGGVVSLAAP
jgi:hypothetical protein